MFAKEARRERRKQHRYRLHPPAAFRVGDGPVLSARCRDISLGGAFLETSTPALFGAAVQVYIWVAGLRDAGRLRLDAVVRWTSRDGFGVQFLSFGARETHALVALFQRGASLAIVPPRTTPPPPARDRSAPRVFFRASRARLQAYRRRIRALLVRSEEA